MTFRTQLLVGFLGLVVFVELVSVLILDRTLSSDLMRQLDHRLEAQAKGAVGWVTQTHRPAKVAGRLATVVGARVTIFDHAGTVLGDSDSASTVRSAVPVPDEVRHARKGRIGKMTRPSEGHPNAVRYIAVATSDGMVVRLGASLASTYSTLATMRQRLLFASLLAFLAAVAVALIAARLIVKPLRHMTAMARRIVAGDYDSRLPKLPPDEFGILGQSLESLAAQLKTKLGELTSERDLLSAILAGMVEGVLVIDKNGTVRIGNPAASSILGVDGLLVDRQVADIIHDRDLLSLLERGRERQDQSITELSSARGENRTLLVNVQPLVIDPALSWVDTDQSVSGGGISTRDPSVPPASPVRSGYLRGPQLPRDADGTPGQLNQPSRALGQSAETGIVVVLHDITRVRRLETLRRDFLGSVSHELRTPVAAIQGYAETLLQGNVGQDDTREFLEVIHRHTLRIGRLVDNLLRLSYLEARSPDQEIKEPVTLADVGAHVAQTMHARALARHITISVEVGPEIVTLGDPHGVELIVENLVENAVKYGRDHGHVWIRGQRVSDRVRLTVSDDGPGIPFEHLNRVFDRFFRGDGNSELAGVGLGLAIVKRLSETMGGSVQVQSEWEKGAHFVIDLPACTSL